MAQEQKQPRKSTQDETATDEVVETDVAERKEVIDDDVDAILDEIDDVLETNAEDFVKSFIQKGGEYDLVDRPESPRLPAAYLTPGIVVLQRLPRRAGARPAAVAPRRTLRQRRRPRAARHHHRRRDVPRRRGDGR